MAKYRVFAQGGIFYIQRKRFLFGWCQVYEHGHDMCPVPLAYLDEQAAIDYCKREMDPGKVVFG